MNSPFLVFGICFVLFWVTEQVAAHLRKTDAKPGEPERKDIEIILGAVLTLFALVVGFSFAMATGRYDLRKNLEAEETVAIGTAYDRAGLLPVSDTAKVHGLLKHYLAQRILFYTVNDPRQLNRIGDSTNELKHELWSSVEAPATANPTPVGALVASSMNEVIDTEERAQAAWWNRIPIAAWALMVVIGICCTVLFGYNANPASRNHLLIALPLIFSVAFFLLADLDSPRGGLIRVAPENLLALSSELTVR